ncbi:MAG: Trifunctional nucleotide phosphoesterase protein YfkN [Firmicutes bacterium]|nr:Trifunctional nucleotide phosphoesterase protein YfkN [Bacillota bacterium]
MLKPRVALAMLLILMFAVVGGSWPTAAAPVAGLQEFTIIHTNDEHSFLLPNPLSEVRPSEQDDSVGGFARLASLVADIRQRKAVQNEPVLLISAGDFLGGSPFAWLSLIGKAPEMGLMAALGYDIVAIGNHEFDYGPVVLAEYLAAARLAAGERMPIVLATNAQIPTEHALGKAGIERTTIKEIAPGVRLGFFSVMGEGAADVAPLAVPVTFADPVETARAAVAELRQQGANVIIAVNHAGVEEDRALAKAVAGIHVIVSAHSHTALSAPQLVGETIIVQSGAYLQYAGVLELSFDRATGKVAVRNQAAQPFLVPLDDRVPEDPLFAAKVGNYQAELNDYVAALSGGRFTDIAKTVIHSDFKVTDGPRMRESPFGNFVTDAMRAIGAEATGRPVDFAIQANGNIRGSIVPASSTAVKGNVSWYDLVSLIGLGSGPDMGPGYPLVSVYLTGEEVRRILEVGALLSQLMGDSYFLQVSGLRYTYDPERAIVARVPFANIPIPSTRAVLRAYRVVGDEMAGPVTLVPLPRGDTTLYHVVTDYYLAKFLPMVKERLPMLGLVLKNEDGQEIGHIDEAIVRRDGQELKVWQTVVEFAATLGTMPEFYQTTAARIVEVQTIPLIVYPVLLVVGVVAGGVVLVRRIRRRRQ